MLLAFTVCSLSLFQISCGNQTKPQQLSNDQSDKEKSESDRLNTIKAFTLLQEKDSIIKVLNSKLTLEKANTAAHKADAKKQHIINDSLQARYEREKSLNTCEDLVKGLKFEAIEKDSIIENLETEIDNYSCEVKTMESKVSVQAGIIESKQSLIDSKDSVIQSYKTQQKKKDFWTGVKTKAGGVVILIETIALLIK